MRFRSVWMGLAPLVIVTCFPALSSAQFAVAPKGGRAVGETYRIEVSGGGWLPVVAGSIAVTNDRVEVQGTTLDFVKDLGFSNTRFPDLRIVLRPAKKHKLRVGYTPVSYTGESVIDRNIVFNGILYPTNMPVNSVFDWKVWRFGYEYDVIYRDRGYFGIVLEGRYTEMNATLQSPVNNEFTRAKAPLPAAGAVARIYPLRNLSITGEITGLRLPDIDEDYQANYADIDVYATFNVVQNLGVQAGWRRMSTGLRIEGDRGDFKFQGLWFGTALRF